MSLTAEEVQIVKAHREWVRLVDEGGMLVFTSGGFV